MQGSEVSVARAGDAHSRAVLSIVPTPPPERTVGRYALHTEIASGGMATVHIGRLLGPVGFARTVAIKRLHPQFAKDPEFVAMFLDEARLAARIRHPNVVSTLDVVATQGELFVVMEYVPGESLARLVRASLRGASARIPPDVAASIMVGVLHGLHAAHEARDERGEPLCIVHRDVSPHNVLVGADGAAHVIDFGVAKARGRVQVTREGQIKGKLSYMPPEQLLGQGLDRRADVFAASIVFWEALTGRRLFQGTDDGEVYAKVLRADVPPPSKLVPGLGKRVDEVVLRGLSRDRRDRWGTARGMALAIEEAIPLAPPSRVGAWVDSLVGEAIAERSRQIASIESPGAPAYAAPSAGHAGAAHGEHGHTAAMGQAGLAARALTASVRGLPSSATRVTAPFAAPGMEAPESGLSTRNERRAGPVETRSSAVMRAIAGDDDSLAAVAGIPWRGRRHVVVVACIALVTGAALVLGGARARATRGAAATVPAPVVVAVAQPPATQITATPAAATSAPPAPALTPMPVATTSPSIAEAPVVAAGSTTRTQARATARFAPKPAVTGTTPSVGTTVPPAAAATATTSAASPSAKPSCDPPYWIDAEGTKRYYRHCATR